MGSGCPTRPSSTSGMSAASIGSRVGGVRPDPARRPPAVRRWLLAQDPDRPRAAAASGGPRPTRPRSTRTPCSGPSPRPSPRDGRGRAARPRRSSSRSPTSRPADRVRKRHGIAGALLPDDDGRPASPRIDAPRPPPAQTGAGAPSGILRSRTALRSSGRGDDRAAVGRRPAGRTPPRPRRAAAGGPVTGSKAPRPPTRLSESGLDALRAELEELTTVTRPAIVARIVAARELGDLRENSDYHEARREQSFAEGRIRAIEDLLRNVEIIEEGADGGRARLGSTVVVEGPHGDEETYTLVGSSEASPACRPDLGQLADRRRAPRAGSPATRSRRSSRPAGSGSDRSRSAENYRTPTRSGRGPVLEEGAEPGSGGGQELEADQAIEPAGRAPGALGMSPCSRVLRRRRGSSPAADARRRRGGRCGSPS